MWAVARSRAVLGLTLGLLVPGLAYGQLSPGLLSEPHAPLEGSGNCLECHQSGKGVDPAKCLACHQLLAARILAGEGLHAREEYGDCKSCHIDHHGREFALVWWGEDGTDSFDHGLAGLDLQGAHADLGCRECHRETLLVDAVGLTARGKDPNRTFLGLGRDCRSCHADEHRGQFEGRPCEQCHSQSTWTPAPGFDHRNSRYSLTGSHTNVACNDCHDLREDPGGGDAFRRFVGLRSSSCADCHADPHLDRFGSDCASCHVTTGWLRVDEEAFDHRLTRYPLAGLHRQVACVGCHAAGEPRGGLEFGHCTDCHRDAHLGQLSARAAGSACESCHDVGGFSPARFTVSDHQAVWALEGAHLAVACVACHRRVDAEELIGTGIAIPLAGAVGEETVQLRFASTACGDCHSDPHGSAEGSGEATACASCHQVAGWRVVTFDHAETGFDLIGGHRELACVGCHASQAVESGVLEFGGLGTSCAGCHADPHRGQLADESGVVACGRCHSEAQWRPATGFAHDRDAAFRLEGAHQEVACVSCHPTVSIDGQPVVRYRPLPTACSACHTTGGAG